MGDTHTLSLSLFNASKTDLSSHRNHPFGPMACERLTFVFALDWSGYGRRRVNVCVLMQSLRLIEGQPANAASKAIHLTWTWGRHASFAITKVAPWHHQTPPSNKYASHAPPPSESIRQKPLGTRRQLAPRLGSSCMLVCSLTSGQVYLSCR